MSLHPNRFEDFFQNQGYVALKNHLYNYIVRKRAILSSVQIGNSATLETGSGMSPIVAPAENVVYCDISFFALKILKKAHNKCLFVVADSTYLPFREDTFENIICSEVLEHIEDDRKAVAEIARTLRPAGNVVVTFPHRQLYFSFDDRFVHHLRRYELNEMKVILEDSGFTIMKVDTALGLLEKIIMIPTTFLAMVFQFTKPAQRNVCTGITSSPVFISFFRSLNRFLALLARLDAAITPLRYATVLMIKAEKR